MTSTRDNDATGRLRLAASTGPMVLRLARLPRHFQDRGIYPTPNGFSLPNRALMMHPDAARALVRLEAELSGRLYFSDIFRSAAGSLEARAAGRKAMPPAYSHHNYGGAFDLAVDRSLKALGMPYGELLSLFESRGWFCHRRDGRRGSEDWHFNYLGTTPERHIALAKPSTWLRGRFAPSPSWAAPAEARIQELYGTCFVLSVKAAQARLQELRFYPGPVDGDAGPHTREAVRMLQRAYGLTADGELGPRTQRTLAYVTATIEFVDIPS